MQKLDNHLQMMYNNYIIWKGQVLPTMDDGDSCPTRLCTVTTKYTANFNAYVSAKRGFLYPNTSSLKHYSAI